jgi:hypothetical protein
MTQPVNRTPANEPSNSPPMEISGPPAQDTRTGSARIPDAVAALSYGAHVLPRLGGGPRIY